MSTYDNIVPTFMFQRYYILQIGDYHPTKYLHITLNLAKGVNHLISLQD